MADPQLPSEKEIKALPLWARVAYACRAARRAQPIFRVAWPEAPQEHLDAIERAIALAEGAARGARTARFTDTDDATRAAARAAADANAYAAADAADTATYAAYAAADTDTFSDTAADVLAAAAAGRMAGPKGRTVMVACLTADFRILQVRANSEKWTDRSPVDPDSLGPLWPDPIATPDWHVLATASNSDTGESWTMKSSAGVSWIVKTEGGETLTVKSHGGESWTIKSPSLHPDSDQPLLELEIIPGDSTPEMIADYLESLSNMFHAAGGVRLTFKRIGTKIYATSRVGVPA